MSCRHLRVYGLLLHYLSTPDLWLVPSRRLPPTVGALLLGQCFRRVLWMARKYCHKYHHPSVMPLLWVGMSQNRPTLMRSLRCVEDGEYIIIAQFPCYDLLLRYRYYEQNQLAEKQISHALANVDPSHRATYTRIQASVRSAFHADQSIRKNTEVSFRF